MFLKSPCATVKRPAATLRRSAPTTPARWDWLRIGAPSGKRASIVPSPDTKHRGNLRIIGLPGAEVAPFACRIDVRIGSFLHRAKIFRHVAEVDPDSRPSGGASAHGVHQNIVNGEEFPDAGVLLLPTLETSKSVLFVGRVRNHNQRHFGPGRLRGGFLGGCLGARGGNPRSLAFHLAEMRGPRGVAETLSIVLCREFKQPIEGTGFGVHLPMRIAESGEACWYGKHREVGGLTVGDLLPREGCGDAGIGQRADGVGRTGGAILGVLVVVEEHAVAFLFPPFGTGQGGNAAFNGAGEGQGGAAHVGKGPARLDAHVNVHAARAAGFGPAAQSHFLEECVHFEGDSADVGPSDTGAGIQVNSQFIGVVEIGRAYRVRVEFQAAEINDPGKAGGIVDDDFLGGAAGGKGESHRAEPGGEAGGGAFLIKGLPLGAVDEAFENDGTVFDAGEGARRNGEIVAHDVELGKFDFLREVGFGGVGDADLASVYGKQLKSLFFAHNHRVQRFGQGDFRQPAKGAWFRARWRGMGKVSAFRPSMTDLFFMVVIVWSFLAGESGWQRLFMDGDAGLHIRIGDWILEHRAVPSRDMFSFVVVGQTWYAFEWLSEVVFASVHQAWGLKGMALLTGTVIAMAFTVVFRHTVWKGANPAFAVLLVFLSVNVTNIHFHARPHVFTLLLVAVFAWMIEADRKKHGWLGWMLVPMTVLWANLHGGFFIMFALLGLYVAGLVAEGWLLEEERETRWKLALRYTGIGAACAAASLLNPYGWRLHEHIVEVLQASYLLDLVSEFKSPSFRGEALMIYMVLMFTGLILTAGLMARRRICEAAWVLFLAYCSLVSVRHVPLYCLIATPIIARELSGLWVKYAVGFRKGSSLGIVNDVVKDLAPKGPVRHTAWSAVFVLVIAVIPGLSWPLDFPADLFPTKLIERNRDLIASGRILAEDQWAGYLIYKNYPRQRVYMDGRHNYYGEKVVREYVKLEQAQGGSMEILERYQVNLLMCKKEAPLVELLMAKGGWRVIDREGSDVLLQGPGRGERAAR